MADEERDEERVVKTTEPGGRGPGRHSEPGDAGDPIDEDASTPEGAPGEFEEPSVSSASSTPRRQQPGL